MAEAENTLDSADEQVDNASTENEGVSEQSQEQKPEEQAEQKTEEKPKEQDPHKGYLKRINKLTAEKARLNERLSNLEKLVAERTKTEEKVPEDLEGKIAFLAAKKAEELFAQREQAFRAEQAQKEAERKAQERVSKAVEKYPDFMERVAEFDADNEVAEDVAHVIATLDNADDVAYYLATHPEEAGKFSPRSGNVASRNFHLVRLLTKLEQSEPPAPKTTAPKPTPKQMGGVAKSHASMSEEDFFRSYLAKQKQVKR